MPLFKPRFRKILLASVLGASLLMPRPLHERQVIREPIKPKETMSYTIPQSREVVFESMLNKLHSSKALPNVRSNLVNQLNDPYFSNHYPKLVDSYIDLAFKRQNIDPIYGKAIFFNRKFNLSNPLSLVSPQILKSLGIEKISSLDSFTLIDYALDYLSVVKKKYPKANDAELFSIYLYGSAKQSNYKKFLELVKTARKTYDSEFNAFMDSYRARSTLKELTFDSEQVVRKSLKEFIAMNDKERTQQIKFFVEDFAHRLDLDPDTIVRIVEVESNFNYLAESPVKAKGLMQVQDVNLEELKKHLDFNKILGFVPEAKDLFNPYVNLVVGMYSYRYLLEKYNWNYDVALVVYNIGPGNYAKLLAGDKKQIAAAKKYLDKMYKILARDWGLTYK